jgi:23S rRNA pseudouridine2605 synthase
MARDYDRPESDKAGAGRRSSDRNPSDRPNNNREEKKIFNRRDKPERGEGGERRSFNSDRKEGGERRPYNDRREGGERRSFSGDRRPGSDRRTGGDRTEGGRSYGNDRRDRGERRSFDGDRKEGDRKSFNSDRPDRRENSDRRSYGSDKRESGDRKPFNDRRDSGDRKPYGDRREGGERRSNESDRREGGEKRSFSSDRRDSSERRTFKSDRPERTERRDNGDRPSRSLSGDSRSFKERKEDAERRLYGKNQGDSKEKRTYGSDRTDDRRGKRDSDKPFSGERRSSGDERKSFKSDRSSKFGSGDRRGSFDAAGEAPKTPNYNIRHYEDNPRIKKTNRKDTEDDGTIRLNRFIANAGVCSRREADTLIESGEIKVNGQVVTELGFKVQPSDTVQYGKKLLNREKLVYVLLNKPKDFLTTTEDPEGRKTVMSLIEKASTERIFPVGRLDRNTTGLLLFTNDGELAQKLTHPSNDVRKIYQVELDKPITREDFLKVTEGVELEDGKADVDDVALIGDSGKFLGLEIHIGRNRIVRRIFEHLGYEVVTLDRVQYAGLTKKDLPRGNWRYISEKELIRLKYFV